MRGFASWADRARGSLAAVATLLAGPVAEAADWPMVQGTEPPGAPAVRPFGVVQVVAEGIAAAPVRGLSPSLRQFEGQRAAFNTISSTSDASWAIAVRRARPGVRGAMPGTDGRVSYYLVAEFGTVPIARDGPTLTDASITLSYLPGARVRVGQFRLPLMDEAVESNAVAAEWVNLSLPAAALAMENPVQGGRYVGGASGFRDVGVELFDTLHRGHVALAYALALTNGQRGLDVDDAKDVTGRVTASWVFSGAPSDPHRQELSLFTWGQRGERTVDGLDTQRIRSGAGVHLEKDPLRIRAEFVYGSGVVLGGPSPSFVGQPLQVDRLGRAIGGYVQARLRVLERGRVGVRYDTLDRTQGDAKNERVSRSLSPMVEYDVTPRVRVQLNYEKRWLSAPAASADTKTIAATMGDRLSAQVTAIF